jgi:hypothetical protein
VNKGARGQNKPIDYSGTITVSRRGHQSKYSRRKGISFRYKQALNPMKHKPFTVSSTFDRFIRISTKAYSRGSFVIRISNDHGHFSETPKYFHVSYTLIIEKNRNNGFNQQRQWEWEFMLEAVANATASNENGATVGGGPEAIKLSWLP